MMSFGERNWHGVFAGQGYVRVWAGRPGSDNPPKESPQNPQRKEFLYHPLPLWKSIICRIYWEEWTSWGRCWWKWLFILSKTRCALLIFWFFIHYGKSDHWSIFKKEISENENLRGRDPILSIQRIFKRDDVTVVWQWVFFAFVSSLEIGGGDLEENGHFH